MHVGRFLHGIGEFEVIDKAMFGSIIFCFPSSSSSSIYVTSICVYNLFIYMHAYCVLAFGYMCFPFFITENSDIGKNIYYIFETGTSTGLFSSLINPIKLFIVFFKIF